MPVTILAAGWWATNCRLHASVIPVMRGDTLIFATDGICSGFVQGLTLCDPPQQIADWILAQYSKGTDDALALVVHDVGRAP